MSEGFTLWLTGLPASGKSTLASLAAEELRRRGYRVEILDGDEVRTHLSKDLGFSKADRDANIRRIGYVSKLLSRNGVIVITAAISPYRETRDEVRRQHERFVEVYVKCSLEKLFERDDKGLYAKALKGEIPSFTGVSDPYEEPLNPELVIESDREAAEVSLARLLSRLEQLGYVSKSAAQ
ncbi:MAG TPA: adenylyl-sulfate kinase [Candidatus Binataceae bacterium]|jgi:adenylylsulfate kinase|nr:adenylyl-sulfate kinase [Candidatus Binataceae bacterium]